MSNFLQTSIDTIFKKFDFSSCVINILAIDTMATIIPLSTPALYQDYVNEKHTG